MRSASSPINVVIPLAGRGARFTAAGYVTPKPLVRAQGRPMLLRCLSALALTDDDVVVLAYRQSLDAYHLPELVRQAFPELQMRFVPLRFETRGQPRRSSTDWWG